MARDGKERNPQQNEDREGHNPLMDGGHATVDTICQMAEMIRQQGEQFQSQIQHLQARLDKLEKRRADTRGCSYKKFLLIYKYPNFMGTEGPIRAHDWLTKLDRTFEISGCTEEQKVQYAGQLLQDEANIWWDTKRQLLVRQLGNISALTWDRFKQEFDSRFFPKSVKKQKEREFATLVQGDLTVQQYAARFMELGRFGPHLIATEEMQAEKFQEGLDHKIRLQVASFFISKFQELVDVASIVEDEYQRSLTAHDNLERKRALPFSDVGSTADKRRTVTGGYKGKNVDVGRPAPALLPVCEKCGKNHGGDCRFVTGTCSRDHPGIIW